MGSKDKGVPLGVSRKSKDFCAQLGHIKAPVEVKVITSLHPEGYSCFGVQSDEEVNIPQSKTKQKTQCALLQGSLISEFKIPSIHRSQYVLQMRLLCQAAFRRIRATGFVESKLT